MDVTPPVESYPRPDGRVNAFLWKSPLRPRLAVSVVLEPSLLDAEDDVGDHPSQSGVADSKRCARSIDDHHHLPSRVCELFWNSKFGPGDWRSLGKL